MRALSQPRSTRHVDDHDDDHDDDRGAVLVLVAVMMTALLGFGAIVIDVGRIKVERRELQNGSDAAALAVAQDCAAGNCLDEFAVADEYADLNAEDDASAVDDVCGEGPGLTACVGFDAGDFPGWVRVDTSTETPDGGVEIDFVLAPVIGSLAGSTRHASAVAAWGPVGSAIASPLTVSQCEFQARGGDITAGTFPTGSAIFYFHSVGGPRSQDVAARCTASPSGQDLPGGFGWLAGSSMCQITLSADGWVSGDPGNNVPQGCDLTSWRNRELIIAIFDAERGTGGGEYHLVGFLGLIITGYRFQSAGPASRWPTGFSCPPPAGVPGNGNNISCIRGEFSRFTTSIGDFGDGPDLGGRVIRMVG